MRHIFNPFEWKFHEKLKFFCFSLLKVKKKIFRSYEGGVPQKLPESDVFENTSDVIEMVNGS